MRQTLTFCHGFGLSPSIFDPLRVYFSDYQIIDWDAGYFGPSSFEVVSGSIAIGQSLGFFKLYQQKEHFRAFVSLGGFFDFLVGSRKRASELNALTLLFESSPKKALESFYSLIKYLSPLPSTINQARLLGDLELLKHPIHHDRNKPLLAITACDDKLVTPAVFHHNFIDCRQKIYPAGGHLLTLGDVKSLAFDIKHFLRSL